MPDYEFRFEGIERKIISRLKLETPKGQVDATITSVNRGPGQGWVQFEGLTETVLVTGTCPVERDLTHVRFAYTQPKAEVEGPRAGLARALLKDLGKQFDQDKVILDRHRRVSPAGGVRGRRAVHPQSRLLQPVLRPGGQVALHRRLTRASMSELETFREETRAWLEANAPQGVRNLPQTPEHTCWGGRRWTFRSDDQRLWFERMVERGWTVPEWPKTYGGGGLSRDEARVLDQEMRRLDIKKPLESLGIWMLGPALLKFGTEAQKLEHLTRIARGEIRWAQGYSEPSAGSDLASVQTKAVDDGDDFIVNGSKIWTTYGDKCDMIFALVRSEPDAPKHLGISFLLIDMDAPGVTTSPIRMISGESHFVSTFFDDVRAPKANVVGERGRGWDVTKYLLGHEREMIGSQPLSSSDRETLSARAKRVLGDDLPPALRADIVQYEMDAWTMGIAVERTRDQAKARQASPTSASVLKTAGTELSVRKAELVMTLDGLDGFTLGCKAAYDWLLTPATTIAGGSNEIQLNIIAKRALSLPGA